MTVSIEHRNQFKMIQKFMPGSVAFNEARKELILLGTEEEKQANLPVIVNMLKYEKRKQDAEEYAFFMNSRILGISIEGNTEEQNEVLRSEIDKTFDSTQTVLLQGRWVSAKREIEKVVPNPYVSQELIDEIKNYITNYIAINY